MSETAVARPRGCRHRAARTWPPRSTRPDEACDERPASAARRRWLLTGAGDDGDAESRCRRSRTTIPEPRRRPALGPLVDAAPRAGRIGQDQRATSVLRADRGATGSQMVEHRRRPSSSGSPRPARPTSEGELWKHIERLEIDLTPRSTPAVRHAVPRCGSQVTTRQLRGHRPRPLRPRSWAADESPGAGFFRLAAQVDELPRDRGPDGESTDETVLEGARRRRAGRLRGATRSTPCSHLHGEGGCRAAGCAATRAGPRPRSMAEPPRRGDRARTCASTRTTRSTGTRGATRRSPRPGGEDVPVLLSVGYSACHWCHVMAHESFEDDATAARDERAVRAT